MTKKSNRLLKIFFAIIIMLCATLSVFVTPSFINTNSVLNTIIKYNTIPYMDGAVSEVAITDVGLFSPIETFTGTITAYGPDCIGCSGITASGYKVAENVDGTITSLTTTYNDREFGEVRVLAAANTKFPFGTIIRVSGDRIDNYIIGIVLDTGGAMRNAWGEGNILIDLLFASEKDQVVYDFGRQRNVTFDVLRYGY